MELHEEILLYLYQFKNDGEFHDILDKFKNYPPKTIYDVTRELNSKKLIHLNSGLRIITGDNNRGHEKDSIRVKILIDGINYLKNNDLLKIEQEVSASPLVKTNGTVWDIRKVEQELNDSFKSDSETDLLRILKDNTFLFYHLFFRKGGAQQIFREIEIGSKLRCDFAWLNDNSDGPEWVLVEIEKPRMKIFTKQNKPTKELNAAIEQVKTWQRHFLHHPADKRKIFGAVARFRYILVAGDKESWSTEEAMKWRSHNNQTSDIEIRTTDVFLRALQHYKNNSDDFWSYEEKPTTLGFKDLEDYWKNYGYMDRMRQIYN
jgi:hypothetical protein